jgi:hypothetical protein
VFNWLQAGLELFSWSNVMSKGPLQDAFNRRERIGKNLRNTRIPEKFNNLYPRWTEANRVFQEALLKYVPNSVLDSNGKIKNNTVLNKTIKNLAGNNYEALINAQIRRFIGMKTRYQNSKAANPNYTASLKSILTTLGINPNNVLVSGTNMAANFNAVGKALKAAQEAKNALVEAKAAALAAAQGRNLQQKTAEAERLRATAVDNIARIRAEVEAAKQKMATAEARATAAERAAEEASARANAAVKHRENVSAANKAALAAATRNHEARVAAADARAVAAEAKAKEAENALAAAGANKNAAVHAAAEAHSRNVMRYTAEIAAERVKAERAATQAAANAEAHQRELAGVHAKAVAAEAKAAEAKAAAAAANRAAKQAAAEATSHKNSAAAANRAAKAANEAAEAAATAAAANRVAKEAATAELQREREGRAANKAEAIKAAEAARAAAARAAAANAEAVAARAVAARNSQSLQAAINATREAAIAEVRAQAASEAQAQAQAQAAKNAATNAEKAALTKAAEEAKAEAAAARKASNANKSNISKLQTQLNAVKRAAATAAALAAQRAITNAEISKQGGNPAAAALVQKVNTGQAATNAKASTNAALTRGLSLVRQSRLIPSTNISNTNNWINSFKKTANFLESNNVHELGKAINNNNKAAIKREFTKWFEAHKKAINNRAVRNIRRYRNNGILGAGAKQRKPRKGYEHAQELINAESAFHEASNSNKEAKYKNYVKALNRFKAANKPIQNVRKAQELAARQNEARAIFNKTYTYIKTQLIKTASLSSRERLRKNLSTYFEQAGRPNNLKTKLENINKLIANDKAVVNKMKLLTNYPDIQNKLRKMGNNWNKYNIEDLGKLYNKHFNMNGKPKYTKTKNEIYYKSSNKGQAGKKAIYLRNGKAYILMSEKGEYYPVLALGQGSTTLAQGRGTTNKWYKIGTPANAKSAPAWNTIRNAQPPPSQPNTFKKFNNKIFTEVAKRRVYQGSNKINKRGTLLKTKNNKKLGYILNNSGKIYPLKTMTGSRYIINNTGTWPTKTSVWSPG